MDETLLKLDQVRQKKGLLAILKADLKRQMDALLRPASLALRQSVITLVFGWVGLGLIGMGWVGVFGFGLVWFDLVWIWFCPDLGPPRSRPRSGLPGFGPGSGQFAV